MARRKPHKSRNSTRTPILSSEQPGRKLAILYGLHPVRAALSNPRRKIHRLLATRETASELTIPGDLQPELVAREAIDRLLPHGAVHQGVAAEVEPLAETTLEEVLSSTCLLVLDRANDPHNVGAVLRSAAAFGAGGVIVPRDHAPAVTGTLAKSASGALEVVPLVFVTNLARAMEEMKAAGFWTVGLDHEAADTLDRHDLKAKTAIVVGAEDVGLRRLTRDHCDLLARLPTGGPVAALNMSNAAAIALYEVVRQRGAAKA